VILDTNALSARADDEPSVVRIYRRAASMELPVIVLGEYRFGIGQSCRRGEYEKWLRERIAAAHVLMVEEEASRHYAGFEQHSIKLVALSLPTISGSLHFAGNIVTPPKPGSTFRCRCRVRTGRMVVERRAVLASGQ
jgi:hypothetical protein